MCQEGRGGGGGGGVGEGGGGWGGGGARGEGGREDLRMVSAFFTGVERKKTDSESFWCSCIKDRRELELRSFFLCQFYSFCTASYRPFFIEGDPHSYTQHIERVNRGERDIVPSTQD